MLKLQILIILVSGFMAKILCKYSFSTNHFVVL